MDADTPDRVAYATISNESRPCAIAVCGNGASNASANAILLRHAAKALLHRSTSSREGCLPPSSSLCRRKSNVNRSSGPSDAAAVSWSSSLMARTTRLTSPVAMGRRSAEMASPM